MRDPYRHEDEEHERLIVGGVLVALAVIAVVYFILAFAPLNGANENAEILRYLVWPH
jgi:hypothetical protein